MRLAIDGIEHEVYRNDLHRGRAPRIILQTKTKNAFDYIQLDAEGENFFTRDCETGECSEPGKENNGIYCNRNKIIKENIKIRVIEV
jgi:hypothetical protein